MVLPVCCIAAMIEQDDLQQLRASYDAFLAMWPLCYGYWKRYADAEKRHGDIVAALAVFERGVAATPYSPDLWSHFTAFQQAQGVASEDVRRWVGGRMRVGSCEDRTV
jgi:pre-mRNA-processing factor 39